MRLSDPLNSDRPAPLRRIMSVIRSLVFFIVAVGCGGCIRDVVTVPTELGPLNVEGVVLTGEHFVTKQGVIPLVGIVADGPPGILGDLTADGLWPSDTTMRICSPQRGLIFETRMVPGRFEYDEVGWHEPRRTLLLDWDFSAFGDIAELEELYRRIESDEIISPIDFLMKQGDVYSVEVRGRFENQPPESVRYSLIWYHRETRRVLFRRTQPYVPSVKVPADTRPDHLQSSPQKEVEE